MRIPVPGGCIKPDLIERASNFPVALFRCDTGEMNLEALTDNIGNGHARAERPERILENDLHIAAKRTHLLPGVFLYVLTVERNPTSRGNHPQDRQS